MNQTNVLSVTPCWTSILYPFGSGIEKQKNFAMLVAMQIGLFGGLPHPPVMAQALQER
jgi:hypothetical protein